MYEIIRSVILSKSYELKDILYKINNIQAKDGYNITRNYSTDKKGFCSI